MPRPKPSPVEDEGVLVREITGNCGLAFQKFLNTMFQNIDGKILVKMKIIFTYRLTLVPCNKNG